MPLELHTWGPAFGLPSIDAECLAAIAYLHRAIPSSEWTLIPSSDPSITPSSRLPALKTSNGMWVTGYDSIVAHLITQTPYNLDTGLTPSQLADTTAYSAYFLSRLAPLLDISLYALPRNWTETTRPAYSTILPFPLTWTVPTALHAAAVERTAHLLAGLSLNGDDDEDEKELGPLDAAMKHIPTAHKKSVLEELAPSQAATIRLHAMAADALFVVEDLRAKGEKEAGSKVRLLFDEDSKVSSIDCLALGYLALMRAAPVPQDFLRKVLAAKYPSLVVMLDDLSMICLEAPGPLPWADERALASASKSVLHTLSRFVDDVIRVTPQVGEQYATEIRRRAETGSKGVFDKRTATVAGGLLVAGGALAYGAWWYRNLPPFGLRTQAWVAERGSKLSEFGALGAMLDFSLGPPADWSAPSSSGPTPGAGVDFGGGQNRIVEADLAVD